MSVVGKDVAHDSAAGHVSGESVFLDDVPPLAGELVAGIVPSPHAHARLRSIDVDAARRVPGVRAVLTAADVRHHNRFGPVFKDENLVVPIWTGDDATQAAMFVGQPLAIIAAESAAALDAGAEGGDVQDGHAFADLHDRRGDRTRVVHRRAASHGAGRRRRGLRGGGRHDRGHARHRRAGTLLPRVDDQHRRARRGPDNDRPQLDAAPERGPGDGRPRCSACRSTT